MNQIDIEGIRARAAQETGDLGFANALSDAQYVGWYKQDIPAILDTLDKKDAEISKLSQDNERLQGLLDRAVEDTCGACEALVRASGHGWNDGCDGCEWDALCTEAKRRRGFSEREGV